MSPGHAEFREALEARLSAALDGATRRVPDAELLINELRRVIDAGGKRLRPAFCYWGFRAAGGHPDEPILRVAAALELLHTFAVVHDDIMDASASRRGQPTVNAKHGTSVALLAGDLALVLADDELMSSGFPIAAIQRAFVAYSRMRQEVIAGQFLELRAAARPSITEEEARRIARLKSGRYSIREPLLVGAELAGAGAELVDGFGRFGDELGEAFQLVDDLLGTFGDPEVTGKPVDSDIRTGKRHLLFATTVRMLGEPDRRWLLGIWGAGDRLTTDDVARARDLIESSGARAETESLLEDLVTSARRRLAGLPIEADARAALEDLARRAVDRAD